VPRKKLSSRWHSHVRTALNEDECQEGHIAGCKVRTKEQKQIFEARDETDEIVLSRWETAREIEEI
jgi:hypothetical protein